MQRMADRRGASRRTWNVFACALAAIGCLPGCGDDAGPTASADVGTDGVVADTAVEDGSVSDTTSGDSSVPDTEPATDAGTDTLGGLPTCTSSGDCTNATVKIGASIESPTTCARSHCGLSTPDNRTGAAGSKAPLSCDAVCAAATYEGRPMVCAPLCRTAKVSGFGDLGLFYDDGPGADAGAADAGAGSVGGLAQFIFGSTTLHTSRYRALACGETPPKTITEGANSFKYDAQHCCCVAGK